MRNVLTGARRQCGLLCAVLLLVGCGDKQDSAGTASTRSPSGGTPPAATSPVGAETSAAAEEPARAEQSPALPLADSPDGADPASTPGPSAEKSPAAEPAEPGTRPQDPRPAGTTAAQPAPGNPAADHPPAKNAAARPPKELFAGWKQPDATFVMTGEMHGYIEPCGCTSGQSGGLTRRADLIRRLRGKGWPLAAVDLGGTMRRSRRQSQIKFETLLAALRDMEYAVLGLGPEELRFGPEYLLTQNVAESTEDTRGLPFVAANVVLFEVPGLEGGPLEMRIIKAGKVKIGVTAVVGSSLKEKAIVQQGSRDLVITDPLEALASVVPKLEAEQPDVLLLLAHGSAEETREYAAKFPQFDLILSAGGPEDPDDRPVWVNDNQTLLVTVGHKGKYAGVVGYYADGDSGVEPADSKSSAPALSDAAGKSPEAPGEKPASSGTSTGPKNRRFRFELVELDQQRFDESLVMVEHMRRYQQRLKAEKIVSQMAPIDHASGAEFVGAERCGECHTKAFAKWKTTPHAKAFESLKHAREGAKDYGITRIYDPECLSCHVTGWHPQQVVPYSSGFINEEFARTEDEHRRAMTLQGNQCENCHGPGSRHIQLIEDGETEMARALVRVTLERARKSMCYECHDLDNSPHFEFDSYWKEVAHPGLD